MSQGVFNVDSKKGLTLMEIADEVTVQELIATTACSFEVRGTRRGSLIAEVQTPTDNKSGHSLLQQGKLKMGQLTCK